MFSGLFSFLFLNPSRASFFFWKPMENSANISYPKSCSWFIMLSSKRRSELLLLPPPPCASHWIFLHFTCYFYHSWSALEFFYVALQSGLTFPVPKNAVCPVKPATSLLLLGHLGHIEQNTSHHRPLDYFSYWWPVYGKNYHLSPHISKRRPHPKERFWNRNCPQTPPQWKEQKSLTGWSGLLLAWCCLVPQSST